MTLNEHIVWSVLSGCITVLAIVVYIVSLWRKRSQPYIWAWVVRIALVGLVAAAQFAKGATYSLALSGTQFVGGLVILGFIMVYYRQQLRASLDGTDLMGIVLAIVGVVVWMTEREPLFAIWGIVAADAAATLMGVKEAIVRGRQESLLFWGLALAGATAAIMCARGMSMAVLLYPYFSLCNALINIAAVYVARLRSRQLSAPDLEPDSF